MKNIILSIVGVLSFAVSSADNNIEKHFPVKATIDSIHYINEPVIDTPFDFNYKLYLPQNFTPYNLDETELLFDLVNDNEDEVFEFNHKDYLPVGFNPNKELNHLFLDEIPWVNEDDLD